MRKTIISRLSKINDIISLHKLAVNGESTKLQSRILKLAVKNSIRSESLAVITTRLCSGSAKGNNTSAALDILKCLDGISPLTLHSGVVELLESSIASSSAVEMLAILRQCRRLNVEVSNSTILRIVSDMAKFGRVQDISEVYEYFNVCAQGLVLAAQPFIMSGHIAAYTTLLTKYLQLNDAVASDGLPCVVRAIMMGRIRRACTLTPQTPQEIAGMKNILKLLDEIHSGFISRPDPSAENLSDSAFSTLQLYESESQILKHLGHFQEAQEIRDTVSRMRLSRLDSMLVNMVPVFDCAVHPCLTEDQTLPFPIKIKDWTASLLDRMKMNVLNCEGDRDRERALGADMLMFSEQLFRPSYEAEMRVLGIGRTSGIPTIQINIVQQGGDHLSRGRGTSGSGAADSDSSQEEHYEHDMNDYEEDDDGDDGEEDDDDDDDIESSEYDRDEDAESTLTQPDDRASTSTSSSSLLASYDFYAHDHVESNPRLQNMNNYMNQLGASSHAFSCRDLSAVGCAGATGLSTGGITISDDFFRRYSQDTWNEYNAFDLIE